MRQIKLLTHNSSSVHYAKILKKIWAVSLLLNFSFLFASKHPVLTKISLESKSNGIIVKLHMDKEVLSENISAWQANSGWFYMTIYDIMTDTNSLSRILPPDAVLSTQVIQSEKSVQIGLKMKTPVENYEFNFINQHKILIGSLHYSISSLATKEFVSDSARAVQVRGMHGGIKKWLLLSGSGLIITGALEKNNSRSKSTKTHLGSVLLILVFIVDSLWSLV